MTMPLFVLEGRRPRPVSDRMEWVQYIVSAERHVALTQQGDVQVCTIFTGIPHRYGQPGPPLVFETAVYRGTEDCPGIDGGIPKVSNREGEFARYSSWDDALAGHHAVCKRVFSKRYTLAGERYSDDWLGE